MKKVYFTVTCALFFSLCINLSTAQGIYNSASIVASGNVYINLQDGGFYNNGVFAPSTSTFVISGSIPVSSIGGTTSTTFYNLSVNKNSNDVVLGGNIKADGIIFMQQGNLQLNGFNIDLGNGAGSLSNEHDNASVRGANGGYIIKTANLNAPAFVNPGNLGLTITTSQNLGITTIRRGQQSQTSSGGAGNSILRYYDFLPANNSFNAVFRLNYLTSELNGLDENSLVFWEQPVAPGWKAIGFDSRDNINHYVEKNSISNSGRFTLSSISNALPVTFISFTAVCRAGSILLQWQTALEVNSALYQVQRSADAIHWFNIGTITAAGSSQATNDYSYTDKNPVANAWYRLAESDLNGNIQFSKTIISSCAIDNGFTLWPNPASDMIHLSITSGTASAAIIKIYDSKGVLVRQQTAYLQQGNNLLTADVSGLAAGYYSFSITSNSGVVQTQSFIRK